MSEPLLTGPIVRAMLTIKDRELPRGAEILAARRARDLGLVVPEGGTPDSPSAWALTMTGDMVLQAYALGRTRWGAG